MEIQIPLFSAQSLIISSANRAGQKYPTASLQKGLLLFSKGEDLAEEGVGFGVPVLKRGLHTVFPGSVELAAQHTDPLWVITALFRLDMEEKFTHSNTGSVQNTWIYAIKNTLAAFIRRLPLTRGLMTSFSNLVRWLLRWRTTYEKSPFGATVKATYTIDSQAGTLEVVVETEPDALTAQGFSEVVVMNEQGAHHFDSYQDSEGLALQGKRIGCWDEVKAKQASFISQEHRLSFTLSQVDSARLFRGREVVAARLAWAGFGYTYPPTIKSLRFTINIAQIL